MKKILVTGGSHAELPMIREAHKAGWYVITTGNNKDGLGHQEADKYLPGDFSDKEFVLSLAREEGVDAILSGCNDFAYLSSAYACEKLSLPGHDSYQTSCTIHHKNEFRAMTRSLGIRTPAVTELRSEDDVKKAACDIGLPLVMKPVDLTGGKGVVICHTLEDAIAAFHEAMDWTRQDFVIAEECIVGSNHGTSMLLRDQKVVAAVFDDEQYGANKYLVLGASMPSVVVSEEAKKQLISDVELIADHLGLCDGLFHTQFMIEANGMPVMIDPCRRAPGDLYVLLASYASDVNYPKAIFEAECGNMSFTADQICSDKHFIARECIMADSEGLLEKIVVDEYLKDHTVESLIFAKPGDRVEDILKYKAGIIISKYDSMDEMQKALRDMSKHAYLCVRDDDEGDR